MTKLTTKTYTQNQKEADGKSKKMLTFDFYPTHKNKKIAQSEQNISINNISKEKGQSCSNRIDPNKQTTSSIK